MEFSFDELTLDTLTSVKVRQFHAYWDKKRGDRCYPAKSDLDLAELAD